MPEKRKSDRRAEENEARKDELGNDPREGHRMSDDEHRLPRLRQVSHHGEDFASHLGVK